MSTTTTSIIGEGLAFPVETLIEVFALLRLTPVFALLAFALIPVFALLILK